MSLIHLKQSKSSFFSIALFLGLATMSGCNVFDFDPNGGGCGYQGGWYLGGPCRDGQTPTGTWKRHRGVLPVKVTEAKILHLSHRYGIKRDSAIKILSLAGGRVSPSNLHKLGLKHSDVKWLRAKTMPTQAVIDQIADALDEDVNTIGQLIQDFVVGLE